MKADGKPLRSLLRDSPVEPPAPLASLEAVFNTTLEIFSVLDAGFTLPGYMGLRYYLWDLHDENVVMDEKGQIKIIDPGNILICCRGDPALCDSRGFIRSYPCKPGQELSLKWLMVSLFVGTFWKMLIRYPPICESTEDGVGPFVHFGQVMPTEVSQQTTDVAAARAIIDHMRPAYKQDWQRIALGEDLLLASLEAVADYSGEWPPRFVRFLRRARAALRHDTAKYPA